MASPTIRSFVTTAITTNTKTPDIDLPATIEAGDTIFVVVSNDANGTNTTWEVGWTKLIQQIGGGNEMELGAGWRKADGTEDSGTVTLTFDAPGPGENWAAVAYAIAGAADPTVTAPEIVGTRTGTNPGTAPNPPSLTPGGGSKDYLFFAAAGFDRDAADSGGAPTNYSNLHTIAGSGAGGVGVSVSERALTTGSAENPGAYTIDTSEEWAALTALVHPGAPAVPAWIPRRGSFGQDARLRRYRPRPQGIGWTLRNGLYVREGTRPVAV